MEKKCPICIDTAVCEESKQAEYDFYEINCPRCGNFFIDGFTYFADFERRQLSKRQRAIASSIVRSLGRKHKLTKDEIEHICNASDRPVTDKANDLLLFLGKACSYVGEEIIVSFENGTLSDIDGIEKGNLSELYAKCWILNSSELDGFIQYLKNRKFVELRDYHSDSYGKIIITADGWEHIEKLSLSSDSSKCFVAMWFNDEMRTVYEYGIKPAIEAKECGNFTAFRVDNHEHNNDITDEIIAGIKECRFMVADLSGYRGGVYYEAGFAKGLGKPVIFICRKDWFDGEYKNGVPIKEKVHFDITHQNIIIWSTPEELKERLLKRIRATID